jgi:hypothetical protein
MTGRWIALLRDVSPTVARCELTHLAREPTSIARTPARWTSWAASCVG